MTNTGSDSTLETCMLFFYRPAGGAKSVEESATQTFFHVHFRKESLKSLLKLPHEAILLVTADFHGFFIRTVGVEFPVTLCNWVMGPGRPGMQVTDWKISLCVHCGRWSCLLLLTGSAQAGLWRLAVLSSDRSNSGRRAGQAGRETWLRKNRRHRKSQCMRLN